MGASSQLRCGRAARANGPNRLVRQQNTGELRGGQTEERGSELAAQHEFGVAGLALGEGLPDADDGSQTGGESGAKLAVHLVIGFAKDVAPLGMPDESEAAAQLGDHARGDFAGPGAFLLPVEVLRADGDVGAARGFDGGGKGGERRSDDEVALAQVSGQVPEAGKKGAGLGLRFVHLPVGGDDGAAHDLVENELREFKGSEVPDAARTAGTPGWRDEPAATLRDYTLVPAGCDSANRRTG